MVHDPDNTIQTSQTNSQKLTRISVFVVEQNNATQNPVPLEIPDA